MNRKLIWSSIVAAIGLATITLLNASLKHELNVNTWISILSYFGVYGIALYLSRNNSGEKIILTLIDLLAVVILVAYGITSVNHFDGGLTWLAIFIVVCGVIGACYSIILNNHFKTTPEKSAVTKKHRSSD